MRHESRTHRVALIGCATGLTWIRGFKSGTLTPNTRSKTYWQKGISYVMSGTVFFICLTSVISADFAALRIFSLTSFTKTMAKRMQEQKGEDRIVAKSKPTTMNLTFTVSTSSSTVQNPVASKILGILKALRRKDWSSTRKPEAKEYNRDAASSSQGWHKDAVLDVGTRKLVASEEDQEHLNFPEDSHSSWSKWRTNLMTKFAAWRVCPLKRFTGRNVIPLPSFYENNFFWIAHWIRIFELRRMSFFDARLLHLCRTRFAFFCNRSLQ